MLRLFFIAGIILAAAALEIRVDYSSTLPTLKLSLPDTTPSPGYDVTKVVFNYGTNGKLHRRHATLIGSEWECQVDFDVMSFDGAATVVAYAEVHYGKGDVVYTNTLTIDMAERPRSPRARLPGRRIRGAVAFRDDFNSFDTNAWTHEVSMYGGYNGEFQVYTNLPQNAFARNGHLYIKPTMTTSDYRFDDNYLHHGVMDMNALFGTCTNNHANGCHREGDKDGLLPPVMSARINSAATIRYGVVEVRARIPTGDWIWPAIWMMPKKDTYGTWPRSGEIDIMESRGNSGHRGVAKVTSTLHWGTDAAHNRFQSTTGQRIREPSWANDFHTWRLEWTPDHLVTYVDNQQIMYVDPGTSFWNKGGFGGNNVWASGSKMAPFDHEFHMILNVAVGGTSGMFSDQMTNKPWKNGSPTAVADFWNGRHSWQSSWKGDDVAMIIDYLEMRYW